MSTEINSDRRTVQMVITFVGVATVAIIGGIIALAMFDKPVPEALTVLGGAALGGLTAMLTSARTGSRYDENRPIEVVNPPGESVKVEYAEGGGDGA